MKNNPRRLTDEKLQEINETAEKLNRLYEEIIHEHPGSAKMSKALFRLLCGQFIGEAAQTDFDFGSEPKLTNENLRKLKEIMHQAQILAGTKTRITKKHAFQAFLLVN